MSKNLSCNQFLQMTNTFIETVNVLEMILM